MLLVLFNSRILWKPLAPVVHKMDSTTNYYLTNRQSYLFGIKDCPPPQLFNLQCLAEDASVWSFKNFFRNLFLAHFKYIKPGSDAELWSEWRPKLDLQNWFSSWTLFHLNEIKRREMLISVKLHAICVIKIHALGSGNKNFDISTKAIPKLLQSRNSQPG